MPYFHSVLNSLNVEYTDPPFIYRQSWKFILYLESRGRNSSRKGYAIYHKICLLILLNIISFTLESLQIREMRYNTHSKWIGISSNPFFTLFKSMPPLSFLERLLVSPLNCLILTNKVAPIRPNYLPIPQTTSGLIPLYQVLLLYLIFSILYMSDVI